jgi:BirA family biotin operon repressor/biotin-[acetyl-CoA-carboxylase] ligase
VIGIGLNVNLDHQAFPDELRETATSLQIETGGAAVDRSELARQLIRRLDDWYEAIRTSGGESLTPAWRVRSEHLGRMVQVGTPVGPLVGRLVDLDLRLGLTLDHESPVSLDPPGQHRSSLCRIPLAEVLSLNSLGPT